MRFGHMLKLYMSSQKLTTREMGALIGISASTVSRLCNDEKPDVKTLIKLISWMFV